MVQIIQTPRSRSWGDEIGEAINQGATAGINAYLSRKNRQDELAEQYRYASLRDKDIERREIAKEQRGSEKNLLLAKELAKLDGNEGMAAIYYTISNAASAAEAIKFQKEMDPKSKAQMLENMSRYADSKESGFSKEYQKEQEQKEQRESPQQPQQMQAQKNQQTPYEDVEAQDDLTASFTQNQQNARNQAPTAQGPQIVFDNRLKEQTQPRPNEGASSGVHTQSQIQQQSPQTPAEGFERHFIGKDKKTGEYLYEYAPKTLAQCKNLDEAELYAKWNGNTKEARQKIIDNWFKGRKDTREEITSEAKKSSSETAKTTEQRKTEEKQEDRVKEFVGPVITKINEDAKEANTFLPALEVGIVQNEKMRTGPGTWDSFVSSVSNKPLLSWLEPFKTKDAQVFEAITAAQIGNFRKMMGSGQITDAKLKMLEKKVASINKDKNSNRALLFLGYSQAKLSVAKKDFTDEILRENNYKIPTNFEAQLAAKMIPIKKDIASDMELVLADQKPRSESFAKTSIEGNWEENLPDPKTAKSTDRFKDEKGVFWIVGEKAGKKDWVEAPNQKGE